MLIAVAIVLVVVKVAPVEHDGNNDDGRVMILRGNEEMNS